MRFSAALNPYYYAFKKVLPGDEDKVKVPNQLSLQDEKDFPTPVTSTFLDIEWIRDGYDSYSRRI